MAASGRLVILEKVYEGEKVASYRMILIHFDIVNNIE